MKQDVAQKYNPNLAPTWCCNWPVNTKHCITDQHIQSTADTHSYCSTRTGHDNDQSCLLTTFQYHQPISLLYP